MYFFRKTYTISICSFLGLVEFRFNYSQFNYFAHEICYYKWYFVFYFNIINIYNFLTEKAQMANQMIACLVLFSIFFFIFLLFMIEDFFIRFLCQNKNIYYIIYIFIFLYRLYAFRN